MSLNIINILTYLLIFISGASIASFLIVLVGRQNSGLKLFNGLTSDRSTCDNCKKVLSYKELVPVLSYTIQQGKCTSCRARIPLELFLGEVLLGVVYLALGLFFIKNSFSILQLSVLAVYLTTFFYLAYQDFTKREIFVAPLVILITISTINFILGSNSISFWPIILGLVFSVGLGLFLLTRRIEEFVGVADLYVFITIFFMFGLVGFVNIFLYSIWFGAVYSVAYLYYKYGYFKRGVPVPFLPYIFFGVILYMFSSVHGLYIFSASDILLITNFL